MVVVLLENISLSAPTVCQTAGRACLGFIGSSRSADDGQMPLWSVGLVKRQRAEYPVKMVFISFACLLSRNSHSPFFSNSCQGLCAL